MAAVDVAGILKSRTLHMANTKFRYDIEAVHNEWCRANGYPVRWYKPQAGRPKLQASLTHSLKRQAPSSKHQASSRKLQAS